jgi:magnesium-transporting ATPase (P-type)
MNINATFLGQIILVFALFMAIAGFYFGKRKTTSPTATSVIAFLTAFLPPLALVLVFLIVLVSKKDIKTSTEV